MDSDNFKPFIVDFYVIDKFFVAVITAKLYSSNYRFFLKQQHEKRITTLNVYKELNQVF